MKRLLVIIPLLILMPSACIIVQDSVTTSRPLEYQDFKNWQKIPFTENKTHSGTKRTYQVDFDKLLLTIPLQTEIVPTNRRSRVEIIAPDKILKRFLVEKDQGYLSLRFGEGATFFKPSEASLKVYVNRLLLLQTEREVFFSQEMIQPQLDILSSHHIEGDFRVDRLSIKTHKGGSYSGIIRAAQLFLDARDNSHIEVYGRVGLTEVNAGNLVSIDGKGLNTETAILSAKQNAKIDIAVERHVKARASDQAQIKVFGTPNLTSDLMENENGQITLYQ